MNELYTSLKELLAFADGLIVMWCVGLLRETYREHPEIAEDKLGKFLKWCRLV
jgi:hypothetical protein